jgi:hypothetical protein
MEDFLLRIGQSVGTTPHGALRRPGVSTDDRPDRRNGQLTGGLRLLGGAPTASTALATGSISALLRWLDEHGQRGPLPIPAQ